MNIKRLVGASLAISLIVFSISLDISSFDGARPTVKYIELTGSMT